MPKLSDPKLNITVVAGSPDATVDASVDVSFSEIEKNLIKLLGLEYKVTCRIRGADDGFTGKDNALFTLGNVCVNSNRNNIPFKRVVSRDKLDEDTGTKDEVYARFWCTPPADAGLVLSEAKTVDSAQISGSF